MIEMEAVLAGLEATRREAIRRESGTEPDSRFDLAIDVLADLSDVLSGGQDLARTLVSPDTALD